MPVVAAVERCGLSTARAEQLFYGVSGAWDGRSVRLRRGPVKEAVSQKRPTVYGEAELHDKRPIA